MQSKAKPRGKSSGDISFDITKDDTCKWKEQVPIEKGDKRFEILFCSLMKRLLL